jgi:hypothetical protein
MWALRVEGTYVLRDGGGGIAGGSDVATFAVFVEAGLVGLGWTHSDVRFEGQVACPLWLASLLTAALPVSRMVRHALPGRTIADGACPVCAYDLTANVSGVCPECGTAVGMTRDEDGDK